MSKRLAITQDEVFDYLAMYINANGYSPTVREIQEALHVSAPSIVQSRLIDLAKGGRIRWHPMKSRTIRVVD